MTSYDYLGSFEPAIDDAFITAADRTEVVDFCYDIAATCDLDFDIVAMAMCTVDRFVSRRSKVAREVLRDRRQFRLVASAALHLCLETQEEGACGDQCLALLSSNKYTIDEIKNMELTIRAGLQGNFHAPTSLEIARHFLSQILRANLEESRWGYVLDLVRFQTEDAVRDYYFTTQLPSTLAIAAILNVFDEITGADRQTMGCALLRDLPAFMSEHFLSFGDLMGAKERLQYVTKVDHPGDASGVSGISTGGVDQSYFGYGSRKTSSFVIDCIHSDTWMPG